MRRIGKVDLKSAIVVDKKTGQLESVATGVYPNIFKGESLPTVEGTLFHVGRSYLEYLMRVPFKNFKITDAILPKERITPKENPARVLLEPKAYEWNPYDYFVSGGPKDRTPEKCAKKCAEDLEIDPALMQQILSAMQEAPHITEGYNSADWPKRFDIGQGRTVVIEVWGGGGNRLYDQNNVWEVNPDDLLLVNATAVIETNPRSLAEHYRQHKEDDKDDSDDYRRYGIFWLNKEGRLAEYGEGDTVEISPTPEIALASEEA